MRCDYGIINSLPPQIWRQKGVLAMEVFISLIIAVAAGVICKIVNQYVYDNFVA